MVDDDGPGASLGLCALAGIVDDEGIELRQWSERHFRQASSRQRIGLARQPFEIAMLAVVDDRIGHEVVPQPEVEGQISVRREKCGVVVGGLGIYVVASRRLDGHRGIAIEADRKAEGTIGDEGIASGITPAFGDQVTEGVREGVEVVEVIGDGERCLLAPFIIAGLDPAIPFAGARKGCPGRAWAR